MLSASEWAMQQWGQVELGDKRRSRRAVEIGARMAARPEASLPRQMEPPAALKATYRLRGNSAVTPEALLAPHCQHTLNAAEQVPWVLMVEDTSELDFTAHRGKRGLGPIGDGRGRGLLLHTTLAIAPETRTVLGLAQLQVVLRQPHPEPRPRWMGSPEGRVWAVSARRVGRPPSGSQWVHVGDRGSDIYEYLGTCLKQGKHFLIRAWRNRQLVRPTAPKVPEPTGAEALLDYARALSPHPESSHTVAVPARDRRPARQARLVLQWATVILAPPSRAPAEVRPHGPLAVRLLRVWEPDPPPGVEPLEWVLLSSLPLLTLADARRLVDWYTCRWLCEDFHQCLKTGCRIERSQLDDGADVQRLLGFAAPIAVRLLQLRQAARQTPQLPATAVVEPLLVQLLAARQQTGTDPLTLADFWRGVARLGGHQGRRRDGAPGWRTLWRGWRTLSDLADGARLFASFNTS